ncbi:MAG: alpha/beta hydrolase [Acidobacteriaceae bacterium]|nr:alpha/beta hydrolase [Acidobacteriaceae bacterium]
MIVLLILAVLLFAALLLQALGTYRDARRYPPPGRLIDIGCTRLHLNQQGTGRPLVLLESGIAASSVSWGLVQPKIAEFATVCSYDRAGLGWSDNCATPRTVEQMVSETNLLLEATGTTPPYVLVGHSFGALLVRAYAHLHPYDIAGLVLLDPVSLEAWAECGAEAQRRLAAGARLSRRGAILSRLGIVRGALALVAHGGRVLPKLIARAAAQREGTRTIERIAGEMRRLPQAVLPAIRAHWSRPKCFEAMALYLEALPTSARAALAMPIPCHVPFIILSASDATDAELRERDSWAEQSKRWGWHIRLPDSGHWVQLEQPDAVVRAVEELVELARACSASGFLSGS